jgi:hypothetical protein
MSAHGTKRTFASAAINSAFDPKRTTAHAHVGQTRDCRFDRLISARDGGTFATSGVPSMCDYSLHLIASRPARVGDKLISTSFPHTMTRGFASVDDRNTAVCLLPGTELAFEKEIRCETGLILSWGLGHKVAKFRQIDKGRSNVHHDALEFPDGKTVLLTQLCKGQRATVLQLPALAGVTVDEAQPHDSTVVSPVVAGLVDRAD